MIALGAEQCRRIDDVLGREWLVANGLGGYASATVPGTPTRRYHGLLVTARQPPLDRWVMLAQCDELLTYDGRAYQVSTTEYQDGTFAPGGYVHLGGFHLERGLPVVTYEVGDTTLTKQVWMAYRRHTTYARYRLAESASGPVELRLLPLVNGRPIHQLGRGTPERPPAVEASGEGCLIWLGEPALPLRLWITGGRFEPQPDWYWRILYRRERERGLDFLEDLFTPGILAVTLRPGDEATLIVSTEPPERIEGDPAVAWRLEWRRRGELEQRAGLPPADRLGRALALAADSFIVERPTAAAAPPRRSIIAGYHWFAETGRDTLIALPGLTLATGRAADARALLTTLLADRRDGLLPGRYQEESGQPDYATADTALWFMVALRAYLQATDDTALLAEVWPALVEIVEAHQRGLPYGIQVDPTDGLLRAGEPGHQLSWMDARTGDWIVTPRRGKAVEVNALWYNALRQMRDWALLQEPARAQGYARLAQRVEHGFNNRFWYAPGGYLYDVVDGETGADLSFRPNQILAIGLPFPALARERWRPVLDAVTDHLLTPVGLRTLSPGAPSYVGWYAGDAIHRDGAYHQGTVWPWLLGPYVDAYRRVYRAVGPLRERLKHLEKHLALAGLGTIGEIFDGDAPHSPQGCIAEAASVGEVLRVWRALNEATGDGDSPA